jgi:hypothetical protein
MAKIDLTTFTDEEMKDQILSSWVEQFRSAMNRFPESIVVTKEQVKKFFFAAGEPMTNYKGVPLEVHQEINSSETALKVVDNLISHLHQNGTNAMVDVYRHLEQAKLNILKEIHK